MRKAIIQVLCSVLIVLISGVPVFAGETAPAAGDIAQKELAAYREVTRVLADNPSVTTEEIDALLEKNQLTREKFEEIDRQVQANPELKKTDEEVAPKSTALEEFEKIPGVRTKLKEPAKDTTK